MADCITPRKDEVLLETGNAAHSGADEGRPKRFHVPTTVWLTFTTMCAIAGLILGAWATWNSKQESGGSPTQLLGLLNGEAVVLVNNPRAAVPAGYTVSNLYAGTGYWSHKPQGMLHSRSDHAVVSYNGRMYVFGGQSTDPANETVVIVLGATTRYNMYLNTYLELAPMPNGQGRARFGYALVGSKIYVFGGMKSSDWDAAATAETLIYDIDANTWSQGPALNFPRTDLAGAAVGGKIYAIGGYNSSTYDATTTVEVLDTTRPNAGWVSAPDMRVPRGDLRAASSNGLIFALGGVTNTPNCGDSYVACHPFTASVEAYDPATNAWSARTPMKYKRGDFAVTTLPGGRLITVGGEGYNDETKRNEAALPWVEEYMVVQDVWVPKAPLPEPRFRFDMAADGELLYAFGGHPTCNSELSNVTQNCYGVALSTILGYYDVNYPPIYAVVKNQ
mmetsp:Transcript_34146/g.75744  ORF Transcript_34146/g.75744 Transcript_34146/m.75744 type:complete len:448 (-) Transcript_34146:647-1990(-)|eukprot:CAMPEP_0202919844 /NCGR_PEP_ID=MMETSP1392-20130828/76535_1 /ASSEMBLY_ACC=CAM_ASM_000868 /TAXON_ID=225041 /ORGANISM="Chlamydomonas chlamydogama, Strain SAG 11-48b" /LENGTH=447 /DNA_ID=CAMNT_0049613305 /DNA_START=118 /DNA_END=1461 /DNA_ORIENTATION=+